MPLLTRSCNLSGFHQHYKAKKKIGKGSFASVYLVDELNSGQKFAVKAFCKEVAYQEATGEESIRNEIGIMRSVEHVNLIKLFAVYETENSIYMVMELL